MRWFVQTASTPTDSTETSSLMVYFDKKRYLFNCGEGSQRLFAENTIKIAKLDTVFVSRNKWTHVGGLPGMLLTVATNGAKALSVCGPKNISGTLNSTNMFTQQSSSSFKIKEFFKDIDWFQNEDLIVVPVLAQPKKEMTENGNLDQNPAKEHSISSNQGESENDNNHLCKKPRVGTSNNHDSERALNEVYSLNDNITNFIIIGPQARGKFDVKKALALGVERGPRFAQLTAGKTVLNIDGAEIHPEQVMMPANPRTAFIYIDCPSADYVDSIVTSPSYTQFYDTQHKIISADSMDFGACDLKFIFHAIDASVLESELYISWMKKFPRNVVHIISSMDYCGNINPFVHHAKLQMKLGQINDKVFIKPVSETVPRKDLRLVAQKLGLGYNSDSGSNPNSSLLAAQFNLVVEMEPAFKIDTSIVPQYLSYEEMMQAWQSENKGENKYTDLLTKYHQTAEHKVLDNTDNVSTSTRFCNNRESDDHSDPKNNFLMVPLGTGSSIPSCKRNVSCNMLYIPGYGYALLDTGEGTTAQVKRFLGTKRSPNPHNVRINDTYETFLQKLKVVYISHMHADHHFGLIQLLEDWNKISTTSNTTSGPGSELPGSQSINVNEIAEEKESGNSGRTLYLLVPKRYLWFLRSVSFRLDIGINKIVCITLEEFLVPGLGARLSSSGNVATTGAGSDRHNDTTTSNTSSSINSGQIQSQSPELQKNISDMYASLGLRCVSTCKVEHYTSCFGVSISHKSGWQVIYSGDTRPSLDLINLALYKLHVESQRLTMLIHEATFYDDLREDAVAKKHSTISETIAVAIASRAETLVLTHFSQRYVGLAPFDHRNVAKTWITGHGSVADLIEIEIKTKTKTKMKTETETETEEGNASNSPSNPSSDMDLGYKKQQRLKSHSGNGLGNGGGDVEAQVLRRVSNLNLAYSFDMAVFSPGDIKRYRTMLPVLENLTKEEQKSEIMAEKEDQPY